jgi:DNA-binding GntR family transcriptional regulator
MTIMATRTTRHRTVPNAALTPPYTLAESAYQSVKELIFDFRLMPGDRFSENELAEQVRVSRTPLRQALQRLQREGFLQVFPKLGWQVTPLDFTTFDELYDLRVLIECHAATILCQVEDRPFLDSMIETWQGCHGSPQPTAVGMRDMDEAFHRTLVEGCANREMLRVHSDITERIRIIRRLDFTKTHRVTATIDEHLAILHAISRRRVSESQRLLRAHIEQSKLEVRHITLDMLFRARQAA